MECLCSSYTRRNVSPQTVHGCDSVESLGMVKENVWVGKQLALLEPQDVCTLISVDAIRLPA